jgi:hypothetical protein
MMTGHLRKTRTVVVAPGQKLAAQGGLSLGLCNVGKIVQMARPPQVLMVPTARVIPCRVVCTCARMLVMQYLRLAPAEVFLPVSA